MKKILSTLLAFVMLATTVFAVPLSAQAEVKYPEASGTLKSGQTYTYDASTETLTISGEGAITGYYWTGENVSPFEYCTVKHIVIEEGITSLGNYYSTMYMVLKAFPSLHLLQQYKVMQLIIAPLSAEQARALPLPRAMKAFVPITVLSTTRIRQSLSNLLIAMQPNLQCPAP